MANPVDYIYSYINPVDNTVFADIRLDPPILTSPDKEERVCDPLDQKVILRWLTVAGASHYVVQWCENSSFAGPTIRAEKINAAMTIDQSTELLESTGQVELGRSYFWRVFAFSSLGGASESSEIRQFHYTCPSFEDGEEGTCEDANIEIVLQAEPANLKKGGTTVVYGAYSYVGTLNSVTWSILSGDGFIVASDNNSALIQANADANISVVVELKIQVVAAGFGVLDCTQTVNIPISDEFNLCIRDDLASQIVPNDDKYYITGFMYQNYNCGLISGYTYAPMFEIPYLSGGLEISPEGGEIDKLTFNTDYTNACTIEVMADPNLSIVGESIRLSYTEKILSLYSNFYGVVVGINVTEEAGFVELEGYVCPV